MICPRLVHKNQRKVSSPSGPFALGSIGYASSILAEQLVVLGAILAEVDERRRLVWRQIGATLRMTAGRCSHFEGGGLPYANTDARNVKQIEPRDANSCQAPVRFA
jgi:hypothetical protein